MHAQRVVSLGVPGVDGASAAAEATEVTGAAEAAARYGDAAGTAAVVGLGKIGLPLALQYVGHGRHVIGCDTNPDVVRTIAAGECHVGEEPGLAEAVAAAVAAGTLSATTDTTAAVREARVVVVIVPVVVNPDHSVAFGSIDAATRAVGAGLQPGTLVIYETTLPVGTTSGRFRAILEEQSGLIAGRDFALAFSPERVLSGRIARDLATYPKVVGGVDPASTDAAEAFYRSVLDADVLRMSSADEAEFVKLIETTYRDVNIALANQYARFADARGLDVAAAIRAANTQPYSHIHQPGVGVGGHCIPVYPYFLLHSATPDELSLPRQSRITNDGMAEYTVDRLRAEVGSLAGESVLILGIAYRGDVKEAAFSSARLLQEALHAAGASVYVDDPLYADAELVRLGFTPLTADVEPAICAIIVQAAHSVYQHFDFARFRECRVVADGRRALPPAQREALAELGIAYFTIGDGGHAARG